MIAREITAPETDRMPARGCPALFRTYATAAILIMGGVGGAGAHSAHLLHRAGYAGGILHAALHGLVGRVRGRPRRLGLALVSIGLLVLEHTRMTESPILDVVVDELQKIKKLADKSIAQLDDHQLWQKIDPDANSVAILMRHMAGNMRSRWTDFRTTDGEKPDRDRDREFEEPIMPRAALIAEWEDGWRRVFDALAPLTDADLQETVVIRMEPHSIYKAISRQIAHYAGHAYQILLLAKHFKGAGWQTLSIPKGQSEEFNRRMLARLKASR